MSSVVGFNQWARRDPPGVVSVRKGDLSGRGRCGGLVGVRTYRDLRAWLAASPEHVYCGSKVEGESSTFDSLFRDDLEEYENETREEHLARYEAYIRKRMNVFVAFRRKVKGLNGKTLGCMCGDEEGCHANVLFKLANPE